jgi:hypothetical protein
MSDFNHGKVTVLKELKFNETENVPVGTEGILTAYVPEEDIYGVLFGEDKWLDLIRYQLICTVKLN